MSNVGTSSSYPLISTNSLNNLNTLTFTTSQTMTMYPTGYTTNAPYTFFHVSRLTGPNYRRLVQSPTNNYLWGHWNGQKDMLHLDAWVTNTSGPTSSGGVWDIYTFQNIGGTMTMRNAGNTVATPNANTNGMRGLAINTQYEPSEGQLAEIVYFNSAIGSNAYQQVEGYLAWKWGLQSRLPSNHPYKNASP
jgi:hypothetical protein